MLTEQSVIGSINVLPTGHIEVRRDDMILRDGEVVSTAYHRHVVAPGDALDDQHPTVAAVATAIWTPEQVAAWDAEMTAQVAASLALRAAQLSELQDAIARIEDAQARLAVLEADASAAQQTTTP